MVLWLLNISSNYLHKFKVTKNVRMFLLTIYTNMKVTLVILHVELAQKVANCLVYERMILRAIYTEIVPAFIE